ncbi:MAG: M14 family metallopeptidase [Bacteriovoracaceae bacterium]
MIKINIFWTLIAIFYLVQAQAKTVTFCNLSKNQIANYELNGFKLLSVYFNQNDKRCADFIANSESAKHDDQSTSITMPNKAYKVFRDYDSPYTQTSTSIKDAGIRAQLYRINREYSNLTELKVIGTTLFKREILALKLTDKTSKKTKSKMLYIGAHHASEWASVEVTMRLLYYFINSVSTNPRLKELLSNCEIWFVPVLNPDGYQYTFTTDRNWRKNLSDNDNDGKFNPNQDGVDINRNYDYMWGYDSVGSTNIPSGYTYRGKAPFSEPETQAIRDLIVTQDIPYAITYHSAGNLILYPHGYIDNLEAPDFPIFKQLAGTRERPAITDSYRNVGYKPMMASELYTVNGEFIDWAYSRLGVIAFTVELTTGFGDMLPDNETYLDQLFRDNLPFALDMAYSSLTPSEPVSHINSELQVLEHKPITKSYGSIQEVELFAKKGTIVDLNYSINNKSEPIFVKANVIDRGKYFDKYVARIRHAVNEVSYFFNTRIFNSIKRFPFKGTYNYTVVTNKNNPILIVSAELNETTNSPKYLNSYVEALNATRFNDKFDIYIKTPDEIIDYFEVLSHYSTIIWYGGDNTLPIDKLQDLQISKALRDSSRTMFFSGQFSPSRNYGYLKNLLFYQFGIAGLALSPIDSSANTLTLTKNNNDRIFTTDSLSLINETGRTNLKTLTNLKTINDFGSSLVNFTKSDAANLSLSVSTDNTIFWGFGFETISDSKTRNQVMNNIVDYLVK